MNIRCIKDLNEITSHMLEVVQAHKQFFGKVGFSNSNFVKNLMFNRKLGSNSAFNCRLRLRVEFRLRYKHFHLKRRIQHHHTSV